MSHEFAEVRSMLFVPAHRTEWAAKAVAAGADAVVFDLEDAVPIFEKNVARSALREYLDGSGRQPVPTFVRINGLSSRMCFDDLEAVIPAGITGVMVPKVETNEDVLVVDRMISWIEQDVHRQRTSIVPVLETASGMRHAYAIGRASSRVAYMGGLSVKGGDVERALGSRWSPEGTETLAMRSNVLLDARAAGVRNPLTGVWSDIEDIDGLRNFAIQSRDLGYEGMTAIHPKHIATINEVFTPSADELDLDEALVAAMTSAAQDGRGAITFRGHMIDEAMVSTARKRLAQYRPTLQSEVGSAVSSVEGMDHD